MSLDGTRMVKNDEPGLLDRAIEYLLDASTLVGAQTSGKGYAQITVPMTDGSAIHLSHIAYFTPKGVCLAGVGLTPDLSVELGEEERTLLYYDMLPLEEDPQLAAAEQLLLERASVSP